MSTVISRVRATILTEIVSLAAPFLIVLVFKFTEYTTPALLKLVGHNDVLKVAVADLFDGDTLSCVPYDSNIVMNGTRVMTTLLRMLAPARRDEPSSLQEFMCAAMHMGDFLATILLLHFGYVVTTSVAGALIETFRPRAKAA